jgi:hypothetical protein
MGANNRFRKWSQGAIKNPAVSLTALNPVPLYNWDYVIFYKNEHVGSRGVIDTGNSKDCLDFIGEYETICEAALAPASGP